MSNVPATSPTVSRRRALIGGAALALLSTTAAGCSTPAPRPEIEALVTQLGRARADSELAAGAATAARPQIAAGLNTVAAERSAHAQALSDEITRITGDAPQAAASASSAPTSTGTSAEPLPPPTPKDVIAALQQSADGAAQLAAQQSGYAAGLLGSIAASCTAASTVALGGGES
jgi:hypothetical protein